MKFKTMKLSIAVAAAVLCGAAGAEVTSSGFGEMAVSAAIANECSIGNVDALTFGTLTMLADGAPTAVNEPQKSASFDAVCTNGAPSPKFKFTSANADGTDFRLKGVGTEPEDYIVYTLGDGTNTFQSGMASAFTGFLADGASHSLTVKGDISAAAKSGKKVQSYNDTITITAQYGDEV